MTARVDRRAVIMLLGGAASGAALALPARAQETGRTYRLGFLLPTARQTPILEAFFDELRVNGFIEGKPGQVSCSWQKKWELVADYFQQHPRNSMNRIAHWR